MVSVGNSYIDGFLEGGIFAFGLSNGWVKLQESTSIAKDTSSLAKGDLVYFDFAGNVQKAISTTAIATADGVVTVVGNPGRVQTTGYVEDVPIESGVALNVGDLLYLSLLEAGKVTSTESYLYSQFVGRHKVKNFQNHPF